MRKPTLITNLVLEYKIEKVVKLITHWLSRTNNNYTYTENLD